MSRNPIVIGLAAVIAVAAAAVALIPAPGSVGALPNTPAIAPAEHAQTIAQLRPPKRERPLIAVLTLNAATEVADLLSTYGVLARANVADVTVVSERAEPIRLEPLSYGAPVKLSSAALWIEPQSTLRAFDERYPDGADYVIVPAIEPRDDPAVTSWIISQHRRGAKIVAVCNGALTLAAAGLLDGRRATAHWSGIPHLRREYPTMQWVQNRRYVVDGGVMTTTGITAAVPAMVALVEAIAGRAKAEQLAADLGLSHWDERHRSLDFRLTGEHRKTFLRNLLSFWRHETVAVPIEDGVDAVALGLIIDTYARTGLVKAVTAGGEGDAVQSRHGLMIHPSVPAEDAAAADRALPPLDGARPALTIERELANVAARYGRSTAELAALILEYPWMGP
jgi:transcriptional regulator GlxA family with amidase domain